MSKGILAYCNGQVCPDLCLNQITGKGKGNCESVCHATVRSPDYKLCAGVDHKVCEKLRVRC